MTYPHLRIPLATALFLWVSVLAAQTNAITVLFIGNCGLYLSDGELDVYVDSPTGPERSAIWSIRPPRSIASKPRPRTSSPTDIPTTTARSW